MNLILLIWTLKPSNLVDLTLISIFRLGTVLKYLNNRPKTIQTLFDIFFGKVPIIFWVTLQALFLPTNLPQGFFS